MTNAEREVIKHQYKAEQRALRELKRVYTEASEDVAIKIEELALRYDETGLQSVIYQKRYQEAIKKQIDEGLEALKGNEYRTVDKFLKNSYDNGFVGNVYLLHQQDIPLTLPIDQEKVVEALKIDSQLSRQYYAADPLKGKLGENYDQLKFRVRSSVSRGIAQGSSWQEVARNLAVGMNSPMKRAMNDSMRIARTEGHRINQQGFLDAGYEAKKHGAEIVKQWDATLDGDTREAHQLADGQIREWGEDFDVGGEKLEAPGIGGSAGNVINCRCCLLQKVKSLMDKDELQRLRDRAEYFGLDKTQDFEDFKKNYQMASQNSAFSILSGAPSSGMINLQHCKDAYEVEALMKNQRWFNVQAIGNQVFDTNDTLSLAGCDLESAKSVFESCQTVFDKYPQLIGKLNSIGTANLSPLTYAQCTVGFGQGGVTINKKFYSDVVKLEKEYLGDIVAGFHPNGTTYKAIVIHELGHAIDDYLTNTLTISGRLGSGKPKWVSADMRPKVMKACGKRVADIYTEVSGYASKNHFEFFAECFAEYVESSAPREVAKEFGRQLDTILKGVI